MESFCCAEGAMHGSHVTAAAGAAVASSTYPVSVQSLPLETQPKSEGFFGWLPGSGIMNKVIEKTKVISVVAYGNDRYLLTQSTKFGICIA